MPTRTAQRIEKRRWRRLLTFSVTLCLTLGVYCPTGHSAEVQLTAKTRLTAGTRLTADIRLTADDQFRYAQSCFEAQAYACAIAEFRRFAHFFPTDPRVAQALLQMGRAQLLTGNAEGATKRFETVIRRFENSPEAIQAAFLKTEAWARQGAYNQALITLNNLILTTTDRAVQDRARFRSAWIHIDRGDWPAARSALNAITPANRTHYRTDTLLADLEAADRIPVKSPVLAGSLSILPGLGQLYCARYEDALIALLVNGGLIWASAEAFGHELYALGGVLGFVEAGFYAGNIYGAIGDAHKYNRRAVGDFRDSLKSKWRVGMLPAPRKDGIGLVLQVDF
jgi:tetratricopeptide (TPR) repeat protein